MQIPTSLIDCDAGAGIHELQRCDHSALSKSNEYLHIAHELTSGEERPVLYNALVMPEASDSYEPAPSLNSFMVIARTS